MSIEETSGQLLGIAAKPKPFAPMNTLEAGSVSPEAGLDGDCRGRSSRRQITVISREAWSSVCEELGVPLPWTTRRANLLVGGLPLENSTGSQIRIGQLILEITGETKPCHRMEQASPGLQKALNSHWRGGVTCRVIEGGHIAVGDRASLLHLPATA